MERRWKIYLSRIPIYVFFIIGYILILLGNSIKNLSDGIIVYQIYTNPILFYVGIIIVGFTGLIWIGKDGIDLWNIKS
jgi:hypothetical protein